MKGIFIHHPLFRLLFPPVYGTLVYVLVLLAFDSILQLEENFFSQEALLCIGLTFALTESLRLVLRQINRLFPEFKSIQRRIFIYLTANLTCSLLLISAGVAGYFLFILGYSSFTTELLTLNFIFLVTTVLYTLVYFGVFYLNYYNRRRLEQETALRAKMEYQVANLQRDINPNLLYSSLETLITLVHTNPDEADNYLASLSKIYRYALENRQQELVPLSQEIESAQNLVQLFNYSYGQNIQLQVEIKRAYSQLVLVPGTLQKFLERAVSTSLINDRLPLRLVLETQGEDWLSLRYGLSPRLVPSEANAALLSDLKKAYTYFTDRPLEYTEADTSVLVRIPLLNTTPEIPASPHKNTQLNTLSA